MAIRPKTYNKANSFLIALEIGKKIINNSNSLSEDIKFGCQNFNNYSKNIIENGLRLDELRMSSIKYLENDFFILWNESINEDVELFWDEINKNNLPYQRKSPIKNLLIKGKFKRVEQWIDLYNNFDQLQQLGFLNKQFSKNEIKTIKELIKTEENKKFELVNKCFQKKNIPFSLYLKFGESMAFLENCNITTKYFTEQERKEIYDIWKSTK